VPSGPTSLGLALRRLDRVLRRRSIVVVVSDFRGPRDWRRPLLRLAARHQVVAFEVRDPREQELVDVGDVWLADPETDRVLRVDTRDRKLRARFAVEAAEERADVARELRAAGAAHLVLWTTGDWLRTLVAGLGRTRRRR
jgi:uncharacterized protein (DUF58 family)